MGNKSSLITEPRVKHKYKLGPPFFNNSEKATAQTASAEFKHNSRARRNQSGNVRKQRTGWENCRVFGIAPGNVRPVYSWEGEFRPGPSWRSINPRLCSYRGEITLPL